ncbi:MAG: hypothetical protein LC749_14825 [Actinobacteria bacterium]|nr:hypothetical protein [Actinomycetota bacterium]
MLATPINEVWTGTPQVQVTESPATRDTKAALTDAILTAMRNHLAETGPVPPPLRADDPGDKRSGDTFEDRAGVLLGRYCKPQRTYSLSDIASDPDALGQVFSGRSGTY